MKITKMIMAGVAASAILAVANVASALSMIPANLGLIVEHTESGFVGKAVSMTPTHTAQGWADEVVFEVTDPIIGNTKKGDTVTWFQARSAEKIPMPGIPAYAAGQEYVIFLTAKAPGSVLQAPMALGQGTFKVFRENANAPAFARNEWNNGPLFSDMDTEALGAAMVDHAADARSLGADQRANRAKEMHGKLHSLRAGAIDLETLKTAAKALKASGAPRTKFEKKGGGAKGQIVKVPKP